MKLRPKTFHSKLAMLVGVGAFALFALACQSALAQPKPAILLIEDELPDEITYEVATCPQFEAATRSAVQKNPDRVAEIVRAALLVNKQCACEVVKAAIDAITPPGGQADPEVLQAIFQAAAEAAPDMIGIIAQCCREAAPYATDLFGVPEQPQTIPDEIPLDDEEVAFIPVPSVPFGSFPGGGLGPGAAGGPGGTAGTPPGQITQIVIDEPQSAPRIIIGVPPTIPPPFVPDTPPTP